MKIDRNTRERTDSAAADEETYGDTSSARVDHDPMRLTSFGNQEFTEPSLAPEKNIGDALINEGAEAPKPHLPPVKVRMVSSPADGLLHAGTVSTSLRTTFHPQLLSWSLCGKTKKTGNCSTTNRWTNFNQLAPSCWRKAMKTKVRQNLVLDPGGYAGRLRGYPFLGGRRALLLGGICLGRSVDIQSLVFLLAVERRTAASYSKKKVSSTVRRTLLRQITISTKPERNNWIG